MKRSVLCFVVIFFVSTNLFPQNKFSAAASVGILNAFGTAEGVELSLKQAITNRLSFQFVTAYYAWITKGDLNAIGVESYRYHNSLDYNLHHVKKEISAMVPIKLGLSYSAGNSLSHPFFGVQWALNILNEDTFLPNPVADTSVPFAVTYSQLKSSSIFVSIGFDMGYSINITKGVNALASVKYQAGKELDYVSFVGGIEYLF